MSADVQVKDRGWNDIVKMLKKYADGKAAAVGVQGPAASEDHEGATNAEIGAVHEYGSQDGRIPERSHFRSTADEKKSTIVQNLTKLARDKVFEGKDADGELLMLGEEFRADIIRKIKSGIPPDLAESTMADPDRGPGPPLWNTSQYLNSISAQVVNSKDKLTS